MSEIGAYGRNVAQYAGLKVSPPTVLRKIKKHQFAATRICSDRSIHGRTTPIPNESAYILSVQLRDFQHRKLWLDNRLCPHSSLERVTINLYDLEHTVEAEIGSAFDPVQYYLPRVALLDFARNNGLGPVRNLKLEIGKGIPDPVVYSLSLALLPSLQCPGEADRMFVDHIAVALYAHLIRFYGEGGRIKAFRSGGLTARQERIVTDMIDCSLDGDVTLSELANACLLSTRQLTRAFQSSFGMSPYRWLLNQRIERAKHLLLTTAMPLAEIAIACGFANQSHFTTTFTRFVGAGPRQWRRSLRS
ncbi:helix-turn-helix transcriptional regulator [Microvirga sp. HBU67558]|uniref:AraC family transcriptional regulator n=1 Tax=Microvirga TaxID=186650 RepID=UPI001B37D69F|nr:MULTISPECIES: AraC family transcriptional regulator [unclassified Microvirga]MBQ0819457.1 helix-turn-helix transcriptional regulator [Microvirga sp. HBU67558]